jgi:hypothetical protein
MLAAGGEAQSDGATKTRAYDFILPYKTEGWEPKLFVQCQFYAGDSGSVSHKVVDQTRSSRPLTLVDYPNARFVEYLDGAGYYASLWILCLIERRSKAHVGNGFHSFLFSDQISRDSA